jgi:hypothetical protein
MDNLKEREKNYWSSATHEDMDRVDELTKAIMNKYSFDRQTASKKALQLYLIENPDKFQSGGNYKKHKTLKRKHRKITNKSKKLKRTRYHRKSKK